MVNIISELSSKGLLPHAPSFLASSAQYLVIMGSVAYGVSNDTSDMDVYGFAIPPKDILFPHVRGEIPGFDAFEPLFHQFQQHHIWDATALGGKGREYDLTVYSISKYFRLLMDNNPNIIDSLYVPENCILYASPIAKRIREKRQIFLHKGCWSKFKGYAYSQLHKIRTKQPEGSRKQYIEKYGYDVKFAYHVVRLLDEVEQLLTTQELNLSRNKEQLKSIRRGEWSLAQLEQYFSDKESHLEEIYTKSSLPEKPDIDSIRHLLIDCLEEHYDTFEDIVIPVDRSYDALKKIANILKDEGIMYNS
ncbi:nucleotidyltransferase domain-containing protein [Pleionea sediminis]|uniref:nucleotidyltransferase domain-containing protein n=1 Tax=Pleionea sediminis TaxID=2569479 RepID=UPI001186893B|nr:nucleotidyltransferase domain-containing protein [Pleionea sediminis]